MDLKLAFSTDFAGLAAAGIQAISAAFFPGAVPVKGLMGPAGESPIFAQPAAAASIEQALAKGAAPRYLTAQEAEAEANIAKIRSAIAQTIKEVLDDIARGLKAR